MPRWVGQGLGELPTKCGPLVGKQCLEKWLVGLHWSFWGASSGRNQGDGRWNGERCQKYGSLLWRRCLEKWLKHLVYSLIRALAGGAVSKMWLVNRYLARKHWFGWAGPMPGSHGGGHWWVPRLGQTGVFLGVSGKCGSFIVKRCLDERPWGLVVVSPALPRRPGPGRCRRLFP